MKVNRDEKYHTVLSNGRTAIRYNRTILCEIVKPMYLLGRNNRDEIKFYVLDRLEEAVPQTRLQAAERE